MQSIYLVCLLYILNAKTKSSEKSTEKVGIPPWLEEEIKSIEFTESEIITNRLYFRNLL